MGDIMTKILLVEDDKSLREIYGVRLLAEGYDIVSAGDGEEALAIAIKDRPQLILSDVMMPKISGFDMLDILRSTTETKNIKVIMMTALSSEDQRQRGESLGADRYLVKSQVGIEDVVRTVHEVLGDAPVATTSSSSQPSSDTAVGGSASPQTPSPSSVPVPPRPDTASLAPTTPQSPAASTPPAAPSMPQTPPADDNEMPKPTAPFSTPRPSGLGDRVIQPIPNNSDAQSDDFARRMNQELGGNSQPTAASDPASAPSTPQTSPAQPPEVSQQTAPPASPPPQPQQTPPTQTQQPPANPGSDASNQSSQSRTPIAVNTDDGASQPQRESLGDFVETPLADAPLSQPAQQ